MTTVVLELPDEVAEQAKSLGVLTNEKITELIHSELQRLTAASPMNRVQFIEWLESTPIPEPWGNLEDSLDAGDYVHELRRQTATSLDE